jgi:chemotaxis methyl-accepting protein methylase
VYVSCRRFCPRWRWSGRAFARCDARSAGEYDSEWPPGLFHLIFCRYLVFTYYAEALRRRIAAELIARSRTGGLLVLGNREALPGGIDGAIPTAHPAVYQRI